MDEILKGYRFREPAPATLKFMDEMRKDTENLKINLTEMKEDIKIICQKLDDHTDKNNSDFRELKTALKEVIEKSPNNYASKMTETWFFRLMWIITLGAVAAIINFILNHVSFFDKL